MTNESTALIVVEQEPKVKPPPTYRELKANDFIALKREGFDNAPDAQVPFFLIAADGLFLHRRSILGRGIVKQKYYPSFLPKLGGEYFTWDAPIIPPELCSQIVDFFTAVYDQYKTEAEVILLLDYTTLEWAIHIPAQKVTGASVESALNPTDIPSNYLIVGTMHSHCNFSAFHSGTDTADADDMDGAHFTIGMLEKDMPEIVSMISLNGTRFTYKPEQLADFSQLDIAAYLPEWLENVYPSDKEIPDEIKELFEKFGKKRYEPPKYTYTAPTTRPPATYPPSKPTWKNDTPEYQNWESWGDDEWEDRWYENYRGAGYMPRESSNDDIKAKAALDSPHWEDYLDDKLLDSIIDSPIFTELDWDDVSAKPSNAQDINFWRSMFMVKLSQSVLMLGKLGMVVDYQASLKKDWTPPKPKHVHKNKKKKEGKTHMEGTLYDHKDSLLPDDTIPFAQRLKDEGFTILEVKEDGSVVIDVTKVGDEFITNEERK